MIPTTKNPGKVAFVHDLLGIGLESAKCQLSSTPCLLAALISMIQVNTEDTNSNKEYETWSMPEFVRWIQGSQIALHRHSGLERGLYGEEVTMLLVTPHLLRCILLRLPSNHLKESKFNSF